MAAAAAAGRALATAAAACWAQLHSLCASCGGVVGDGMSSARAKERAKSACVQYSASKGRSAAPTMRGDVPTQLMLRTVGLIKSVQVLHI
jgi:hypothetical protein